MKTVSWSPLWHRTETLGTSNAISSVKCVRDSKCLRQSWASNGEEVLALWTQVLCVFICPWFTVYSSVSLLTGTTFLVPPCAKLFLSWQISVGSGSKGFIWSVTNCLWVRSQLFIYSPVGAVLNRDSAYCLLTINSYLNT